MTIIDFLDAIREGLTWCVFIIMFYLVYRTIWTD